LTLAIAYFSPLPPQRSGIADYSAALLRRARVRSYDWPQLREIMPGRTGRARIPTALKLLRGNPGKRALPPEPIPPSGKAMPPSWLTVGQRALWDELAPRYEAMGCLTVADTMAFANAVVQQARIIELIKLGEPIPDSKMKIMDSLWGKFGGNPADRSKVKREDPADPKAKLGRFRGQA